MPAQLHHAADTFALQFLERAQRLIDIVLANEDLQWCFWSGYGVGSKQSAMARRCARQAVKQIALVSTCARMKDCFAAGPIDRRSPCQLRRPLNLETFMNNAELADTLVTNHAMSKADARKAVDDLMAVIVAATAKGEEVSLTGFGKFKVKDSPAREGRNPATGDTIQIAASKKLTFAPAKAVKDALNG